MTKHEADKKLQKKFEELNGKTESAESNVEYMQLVDSMLKVYTVLVGSGGFESGSDMPGSGGVAM